MKAGEILSEKNSSPKGACRAREYAWLSSLYFTEGLPNAIVATASVAYYKSMGFSNTSVAALTSMLYLPWVLKGFWGPFVDSISTKRRWILGMMLSFIVCFALLSLAQFTSFWVVSSIIAFWALGFFSATFDVAADGFYILALDEKSQSFNIGVRNAFYRLASLFGQGGVIFFAGEAGKYFGDVGMGWGASFAICALVVLFFFIALKFYLPYPDSDTPRKDSSFSDVAQNVKAALLDFFKKPDLLLILAFILFYRFPEAQLMKMVQPFLLDPREEGGLGLALSDVAFVYGTMAPISLLCGCILGGILISKTSLKKMLIWMSLAINLPNLIYIYMAHSQPCSLIQIAGLISIEQFGYGFGFAAYMVYLIFASRGENKTSSYAICTSFMALGLTLPGFFSGELQTRMGYLAFFEWVMVSTLISLFVTYLAYKTILRAEKS